jgi:hypothetical protein
MKENEIGIRRKALAVLTSDTISAVEATIDFMIIFKYLLMMRRTTWRSYKGAMSELRFKQESINRQSFLFALT